MDLPAWVHCNKKLNHAHFIPAREFSIDHIPRDPGALCSKTELFGLIHALADLTVLIRGCYVSQARRPQDPLYNCRGSTVTRTGSGWVSAVTEDNACRNCGGSGLVPELEESQSCCYKIRIHTASHVVYDEAEARSTLVDLFFDSSSAGVDAPYKTSFSAGKAWRLECVSLLSSNPDLDCAALTCVTYDAEVYHRLRSALQNVSSHTSRLPRHGRFEYEHTNLVSPVNTPCHGRDVGSHPSQALVAIVSHPHGRPKQISFGALMGRDLQQKVASLPKSCSALSIIEEVLANSGSSEISSELCHTLKERVEFLLEFGSSTQGEKCMLIKLLLGVSGSSCGSEREVCWWKQIQNCPNCDYFSENCKGSRSESDSRRVIQVIKALNSGVSPPSSKNQADGTVGQGLKWLISWAVSAVRSVFTGKDNDRNWESCSRNPEFQDGTPSGTDGCCSSQQTKECDFDQPRRTCCQTLSSSEMKKRRGKKFCLNERDFDFLETKQVIRKEFKWRPVYDAPTCPGSSGAPVLILPKPASAGITSGMKAGNTMMGAGKGDIYTHSSWQLGVEESWLPRSCHQGCPSSHQEKTSSSCSNACEALSLSCKRVRSCRKEFSRYNTKQIIDMSHEADMENISVLVVFPKGTMMYCDVYLNTRTVREEKERLLDLGGEYYGPAESFWMFLVPTSGAGAPFKLDDEAEILTYIDRLADDTKLTFVPKQEQAVDVVPALGISLKH